MTIPDLTDCANQRYMAPVAGAITAVAGLDRLFPAPPVVHWALAGAATDAYCQGGVPAVDKQLIMCAAGGALGGYLAMYFLMMR